jgi:hypothetical protein
MYVPQTLGQLEPKLGKFIQFLEDRGAAASNQAKRERCFYIID